MTDSSPDVEASAITDVVTNNLLHAPNSTSSLSASDNVNSAESLWNYEIAIGEIEAIITRIEGGELDLEEVFDQFAVAVEQLRQCESFLAQRQQQMDLLIETLTDEVEF